MIGFLKDKGFTVSEATRELASVYGENCCNKSTVSQWYIDLGSGRKDLNDKSRSGRPVTACTDANMVKAVELIKENWKITQYELHLELDIAQGTVNKILKKINYRKISARWIPYDLNDDQKQRRVDVCQDLLERYEQEGFQFLHKNVTADETWPIIMII